MSQQQQQHLNDQYKEVEASVEDWEVLEKTEVSDEDEPAPTEDKAASADDEPASAEDDSEGSEETEASDGSSKDSSDSSEDEAAADVVSPGRSPIISRDLNDFIRDGVHPYPLHVRLTLPAASLDLSGAAPGPIHPPPLRTLLCSVVLVRVDPPLA